MLLVFRVFGGRKEGRKLILKNRPEVETVVTKAKREEECSKLSAVYVRNVRAQCIPKMKENTGRPEQIKRTNGPGRVNHGKHRNFLKKSEFYLNTRESHWF